MTLALIGNGAGQNSQARPTRQVPVSLVRTETQVAVATTGTLLYISNADFGVTLILQSAMIILRNASPAGQLIRIGNVPDFVGPNGFLLPPPDAISNALQATYTLWPVSGQWVATADAVGALMDITIRETTF